ncbi:MAG TPA: S41 family peptidase [Waddliaceae bacterium]
MKVRSFLIFFSFFIALLIPADAKQTFLASGDVKEVMSQLFEYHIDKKEMNIGILERSLKIYLKQFDPSHIYLLQEEAFIYTHPTDQTLRKMLGEYEKDRFTLYFTLNQKIQESIVRARTWRRQWEQSPHQLIEDAKKNTVEKLEGDKEERYASSLAELKERHYKRFIAFVSLQMKELKSAYPIGQEEKIISLCEKQLCNIENEYLGLDDLNRPLSTAAQEHLVILRTIKALAHSLDAHTAYYSPEEAHALKVQLEKGMCGIGVILREGIDGITIHDMVTGGPAEKSGQIKKGDMIIEVDGEAIKGFSFQRVLEVMKGKEGTKTILGLIRHEAPQAEFLRVELVRSKIILADQRVDVEAEPFGDGYIGKITLYSFYEGDDGLSSEKDLKHAIEQLREKGPLYGLILDMRENTGGFLSQAVKVTGLFISSGVVVISKYSDGSMKYYRAVDGMRCYDGPLVVLISRGSASATEIVAQSLKDYGTAVVVGDEQTYGKGTIQHQTITSDESSAFFKVTIGRYYTVSGKSTQIEGVKADIMVPSAFNFEKIGEAYLEYPLPADWVASAYQDSLSDIEPLARKWFQKYYLPSLQQKEVRWEGMMPTLQANSARRINQNKNFQLFLKEIAEKVKPIATTSFGVNDLQMDEAVNVVKDMIFMTQSTVPSH